MVGNCFVPARKFFEYAASVEGGILGRMIISFYNQALDAKQASITDAYYLGYPFHLSYVGSCVSFYDELPENYERYDKWLKDHPEAFTDDSTQLPVFTSHYDWKTFYQSRLKAYIDHRLSPEDYEKYYNQTIVMNVSYNNCLILTEDADPETFRLEARIPNTPYLAEKRKTDPDFGKETCNIYFVSNVGSIWVNEMANTEKMHENLTELNSKLIGIKNTNQTITFKDWIEY